MPVTSVASSWTARVFARAFTSEGMLGMTGCAIACASGSFALYMNMNAPAPTRPAETYFTVFSQLSRSGRPTLMPVAAAKPVPVLDDDIDPIVTGSIAQREAGNRPILRNMLLRQVDGNSALVEVNDRLAVYKVGDLIPGAGRLVAMIRRDGRPALETSQGLIVESY